jgi:polygalacturonase
MFISGNVGRRDLLRSGAILAAGTVLSTLPGQSQDAPEELGTNQRLLELRTLRAQALANTSVPGFHPRSYSVLTYGADPTGAVDSRAAFNAAIVALNAAGGGSVVVPAGSYLLNGPIYLKSNINLHLNAGSYVLFGNNPPDYLPPVLVRWGGVRCYNYSPLIYANGEVNIAITGTGTLDGNCYPTWQDFVDGADADAALLQQMAADGVPVKERVFGDGHYLRPTFFEPYNCRNVWVDSVTFKSSPFWTIHPTFCNNVTVSKVTVLPGITNDDGCDPDSCSNVLIENCSFNTIDDNISIKAGMAPDSNGLAPCTNIVIQNCTSVDSYFGAVVFGSNMSSGISNVFVTNHTVINALIAVFVKGNVNLGGYVENVLIENSLAEQVHHLLVLEPNAYGSMSDPLVVPTISGMTLQNFVCQQATVSGIQLGGLVQNPILNIELNQINIESSPKLFTSTYTTVQSSGVIYEGKPAVISETA